MGQRYRIDGCKFLKPGGFLFRLLKRYNLLMKLPESAALELLNKHGFAHPEFVVVGRKDYSDRIFASFARPPLTKVVVKANLPMSGKKKAGLVQICDYKDVAGIAKKMGVPVIVEEFVEHKDEYFVALKAVREGVEVYYSVLGGIDVEQNWGKVGKRLVTDDLFDLIPEKSVREWVVKLYQLFQNEDATYLEINPFTIINKQMMPLGVVLVLDDAAEFRHPDWEQTADSGQQSEREKKVAEVDGQIKGSVKLVEVPQSRQQTADSDQLTALMAGGGGAALFLCDAILENGLKLADYAEFSGNPPEYAVYELAKQVLKIPGIKNLVIGSGIANFTPVTGNFRGIIQAFKESPEAKKLNIVIRRCGPEEDAAIELMKNFAKESGLKIQVFGRETGMTEVVKKV